jgi:hypothetical protein
MFYKAKCGPPLPPFLSNETGTGLLWALKPELEFMELWLNYFPGAGTLKKSAASQHWI